MHDATLFVKNVQTAIKVKGMKVGEVEKSVNLRPGFLSRWSGRKDSAPKLDVACRLADAVGEDMTDLLTKDYETLWHMGQLQAELRKKEEEIDRIKNEMESLALRRFRRSLSDEEVRKVIKGWKEEA